jgi:hypothetical protein
MADLRQMAAIKKLLEQEGALRDVLPFAVSAARSLARLGDDHIMTAAERDRISNLLSVTLGALRASIDDDAAFAEIMNIDPGDSPSDIADAFERMVQAGVARMLSVHAPLQLMRNVGGQRMAPSSTGSFTQ